MLTAQDATSYGMWVGDVEVTSANSSSITGQDISGKVSYDAATNTLTLDNATIAENHWVEDRSTRNGSSVVSVKRVSYAIYYPKGKTLTIRLVGDSKIKAGLNTSWTSTAYGVSAASSSLVRSPAG